MTTLRQYEKAKTLAERGSTEGEKQAAIEAMKRMEAEHPELRSGTHCYPPVRGDDWAYENGPNPIRWATVGVIASSDEIRKKMEEMLEQAYRNAFDA